MAEAQVKKITLNEFKEMKQSAAVEKIASSLTAGRFMECHTQFYAATGMWIPELVPVFQKLDAHTCHQRCCQRFFTREFDPGAAWTPRQQISFLCLKVEHLSRIGFHATRVNRANSSHAAVFNAALDRGCNLVDTALTYQNGDSERLLGSILPHRPDVFVVSKAGYVAGEAG